MLHHIAEMIALLQFLACVGVALVTRPSTGTAVVRLSANNLARSPRLPSHGLDRFALGLVVGMLTPTPLPSETLPVILSSGLLVGIVWSTGLPQTDTSPLYCRSARVLGLARELLIALLAGTAGLLVGTAIASG